MSTSKTEDYYQKILEATEYVQNNWPKLPTVAIVLGTGLGSFADQMEDKIAIPYKNIPHFPQSTVKGHDGNLIFGQIGHVSVAAMQGRFHYYEGYSMKEVTFPIRIFQMLGIKTIFMSNAAGGVNASYSAGDIVFVTDHISLHQDNPLRGDNDDRLGERFPDMLYTYSTELIKKAEIIARTERITTRRGVYFGWPGPNLETAAEYNMIHILGGDLVGMSTVPEVLAAKHAGMDILVASVVTNVCYPIDRIKPTTHQDVIDVAKMAEPRLSLILSKLIRENL